MVYVHGGVSGTSKPPTSLAHSLVVAINAATALDAVEEAVCRLEDDPELNAGWGSVLNHDGAIELDAGIADGATGHAGGVVGVSVRHPISLARRVMTSTPHVLMAGEGAMALGESMDVLETTTESQIQRYKRALDQGRLDGLHYGRDEHVDTVGAVALDSNGDFAAASSTGGVFGKLAGRVGDSAIFGAGTWAHPLTCAVSATGDGEPFLRALFAHQIHARMLHGRQDLAAAARDALAVVRDAGGRGGAICVDAGGLIATPVSSDIMYRASRRVGQRTYTALGGSAAQGGR
jgi:isoaspartyl peptidase/L-asparaginase-like protein (Ntn-hydrolase superfamily)